MWEGQPNCNSNIIEKDYSNNSNEMERYNELRDCLSLKSFLDIHRDEKYSINIEGNMYDIPIKDMPKVIEKAKEIILKKFTISKHKRMLVPTYKFNRKNYCSASYGWRNDSGHRNRNSH